MYTAVAAFLTMDAPGLIDGMLKQLRGTGIPFVIVNQSSDELVYDRMYPTIEHLENLYFAAGWNRAMRNIEADFVWMLNDDVEGITREMFDQLLEELTETNCLAATPAFNSPHRLFNRDNGADVRRVQWIDWCCPLVDRTIFNELGGFDEQFTGYGADIDICKRARDTNHKCIKVNYLELHHLGSKTTGYYNTHKYMANVEDMNEKLKAKWGVNDWTELTV